MLDEMHPNLAIMRQLDMANLNACEALFSESFVWHYFNENWPEVAGNYSGVSGLKEFFAKVSGNCQSTFQVNPVDVRAVGDELVVVHARNRLALPVNEGGMIEFDAVVIWRIVEGQIVEAWDIPAVNTVQAVEQQQG